MKKLLTFCALILLVLRARVFAQGYPETATLILREHSNSDQQTPDTIYRASLDGTLEVLVSAEENHIFSGLEGDLLLLDGDTLALPLSDENPTLILYQAPSNSPEENLVFIQDQTGENLNPLVMPERIDLPLDGQLYTMSSESDPNLNFYFLEEGKLTQLTDVESLFPDAKGPVLSSSVDFISLRPCPSCAFLYRARLRDASGADHNALYLYDFEKNQNLEMPFFGKDPDWHPNGSELLGSRLEQVDGKPLYIMWIVDLRDRHEESLFAGCNGKWAPGGQWIAYDVHENAQWQGYTDCFGSGEVEALNLETGAFVHLTQNIDGFVSLIEWLPSEN